MKNLFTNSRTRWLGMVICTCMLLLWNAHAWATYYAIGSITAWNHTSSEQMTQVGSTNTYYKVVSNKASGTYMFRVDEGSWEQTHGWSQVTSGSDFTLANANSDNNINITLSSTSTLTVWFNSSNNKVWVTSGDYATQTIYVIGSNSWTDANVKAHVWTGDADYYAWASDQTMTKESTISRAGITYKVYSYTFPNGYKNVIFRYPSSAQTDDLTWNASTPYYSIELSAWFASTADALAKYLVGQNWTDASWDHTAAANKMTDNGDGSYSKNISISDATKEIALKISAKGTWTPSWDKDDKGTGHNLSQDFGKDNDNNLTFKVSHAGTTKITLTSTGKINVDAPYQVSYAAGTGATGTVSASAVTTYGSTCTLSSSTFSKTGYTQDGWSTSDGGGKSYNLGGTYTGGYEDVTLYPHWSANSYTTSNNIKESDGSTNAGTYKVTYDATSITYTSTPSKTGYTVEGLYYETSLSNKIVNNDRSLCASTSYTTSGSKWNQTSAPTMYVKWVGNTYYVSYNANGGSGTMTNSTHTYGTASNLKTCTFTAPSGYTFAGWATSADGSVVYADGASVSTLATSGTYPLYAKWDELSGGSVTLTAGTGGKVSKDNSVWGASATITDITSDQAVNIYAQANTGYTFSTWTKTSGSGSVKTNAASGAYNAIGYANDEVTASFTENMSSLSVSRTIDEGSPSIAAPTVTGSYTNVGYATTRTITAAAAATGYALTSWTVTNGARTDGGGATANPITVRSNGNASESVTVAANYTIQSYTISASNSNVTYSPASGTSFKYGATGSKMTITPKSGYKITGITSNNGAITASADNNAAGSWTVTGTMPAANVTLTVTTAALSTIYLQGRFRIRTASGVESYKSLGSATASGWSSEWVTSGTSQISMTYNYETGFYDLVTYRSAAELKNDGNLYFYLRVGSTNTYPTSDNLTVPSSKPGSANAQTSIGRNFHFNDNGDYINVVLHYDDANKKLWYTGEAETVYSTTCYAGDHGSINAKGTAISKNASSSVNIGTNSPISATPESGYSFDKWVTTGSVTVTDPYSASTTVTASAASGTVTATYLKNSGWYLHGVIDGYTSWETSAKERPVDRPYRGISGVYYRRITNLDNDAYFGIHDGTNKYSGHESTSSDYNYKTLNTAVQLYVNSSKSFQAKDDFDNNWVVIKTTDTKKMWIQSPATYYTVTISSDHGTVTLKEKLYGGLETVKFASGETIHVEIDTVAHYSIASVSLGATAVSMSKSGTKYVGDAVMPASDATLTVTYTPWYKVQLAASPAAAADAPTAAKTTGGAAVAHNSYVLSGTSVTFTKQSAKGGYTWDHWENNGASVGTGNTYVATISATTTVTAVYTPNKYTITLDNQCVYSDGTHTCGEATEFEATYDANYFTCYQNDAPSSYNYTFGGYYSAVGGGGDQIITDLGALVDGATVYTDASGNWTYDGEPTVYAKWSKSYTTGLSEGINANGGSGGAITLTYNSSATSGFTPSTRTGYLLAGYYTASDGGSKVINADGTIVSGDVDGYVDDGKWAYCSSTTFKIYAHWTPITYTIAFDKNDDPSFLNSDIGDDPGNIAATYGVLATMPANPYTRMGYTFNGWATEAHKAKGSVPVTDYDYQAGYSYMNLASTQGATVTLYPKWTGNLYTVSLNARGGTCAITSMNVRYGEEYGTGYSGSLPTPLAPYGKTFIGWYTSPTGGSLVTKDTKMSTVGAHTLYARYSDIAMVYFKNSIGWSEVYVTYDAYWDNEKGTGNWEKIYHKMTQIYGTDVYYDQIPATILASWKGDIAFNSEELLTGDKHAPQDEGNYGNYNKGEVVFRHDFDSRATMFVPKDVNTNNTDGNYQKNSAQYISTGYKDGTTSDPEYTSGYWMKYGETYSGYLFSYQKNAEGDFSTECGMNTSVAGDTIFVYTVKMDANTRYDLRIRKDCQTTNTKSRQFHYGTEITSAACTDLKLVCDPSNNSWMQTTAAGEYKFILTCKKDGHMYLTVKYPLAVNDYQVLYSWNDGSAKTYASEVIKAHPDTVDTISVFVHKLYTPVVSRSMKIQKCTGINGSGVPTWTDVTGGGIDLTDVTANGVYNFEITQPESGDPTGAFAGKYEGNYYIRTACSDGGWDQYKEREDNVMTYSAYSMTQTLSDPYSHYYCRYVGSTSTDITFAVATKYSPNISGTMTGDATIGNEATTLPANANVRFSWNEETNAMARAYIKDAQGPSNARFLVMHGADDDMIFNPNGSAIPASGSLAANELQFDDKGDWVYQVMLQAKPGAQVSIIAKYGSGEGVDRYLVGGPSSFETIMGGSGDNKYTIMAIYDFKTNRLMNAWTPSGDITDALSDVDMLWIRHRQNSAQQITFNGGSLTNVKAVGAIRLDYNDLVGHVASWTYETRPLLRYFISFPFDVNVSDIFGLHGAELGREFVIRKYDGAERAKNGLFLGDGDTYWIDLTMDSVMHANEGYSLVFDNEYLNGDLGSIWENKTGGSSVYLYFPAAAEIPSISDANKGTTLAEHVCEDTRSFDYKGASVSHANSDSHWNLIGSPLFVDSYVYNSSGTNGQAGDKERTTLDSYYAYNVKFNYWEPELYHKGDEYYACKAMHAMLVQFAGSVTWSKNEPNPSLAPSRERKEETVSNLLITLNLLQNGADGDRTYIKLDEDGNSEFMLCEDLFKIDNKKIPNIFSYASGNAVAYNKVAVESQTINLGVDIRKNDTYTFTMPENVAGSIILIDRFDGTRTNLNIEHYEIYLNRGSYYDRFAIEINVLDAPTAIDGAADGQGSLKDGKAHKFIMNDMMYIIRDGVLYDAQGKRVK